MALFGKRRLTPEKTGHFLCTMVDSAAPSVASKVWPIVKTPLTTLTLLGDEGKPLFDSCVRTMLGDAVTLAAISVYLGDKQTLESVVSVLWDDLGDPEELARQGYGKWLSAFQDDVYDKDSRGLAELLLACMDVQYLMADPSYLEWHPTIDSALFTFFGTVNVEAVKYLEARGPVSRR